MKIHAKKVVVIYADVTYNGWDYKVWPDGQVDKWAVDDENQNGHWAWMSEYDNGYDEIRQAGLTVLEQK